MFPFAAHAANDQRPCRQRALSARQMTATACLFRVKVTRPSFCSAPINCLISWKSGFKWVTAKSLCLVSKHRRAWSWTWLFVSSLVGLLFAAVNELFFLLFSRSKMAKVSTPAHTGPRSRAWPGAALSFPLIVPLLYSVAQSTSRSDSPQ